MRTIEKNLIGVSPASPRGISCLLSRRDLIVRSLLLTALPLAAVPARTARAEGTIETLGKLADLLKNCGDIMKSIGDGFAHLVNLGVSGYDAIAARRTYDHLMDLYSDLTVLGASQRVTTEGLRGWIITALDYRSMVDSGKSSPEEMERAKFRLEWDWAKIQKEFSDILTKVSDISAIVHANRSDFILEDAYRQLVQSLAGRRTVLAEIIKMPAPLKRSEITSLEQVRDQYDRLIIELSMASIRMSEYIRQQKGAPSQSKPGATLEGKGVFFD